MADIRDPIAWCEEMLKESAQAQAFFLPVETRPKEYPALTKPMGKFWHTGIVKGDKVFETFNNKKYKVSSADDRLPELMAQKAKFVPVKASTRKLKKEIKSGTSCDEFVLRSTGHSGLSGADKGDKFPEDVFNILTKTAALSSVDSQGHIFLTGLPGAGKTTEAERISKETGLPLVSLDGIPRSHGTPPPNTETVRKFIKEYLDEPHVIEGAQILGMNKDDFDGSKVIFVDQPEDVIVNRLINRGLFVDGGERLIGEGARSRIEKEHRNLAPVASEFIRRIGPGIISPENVAGISFPENEHASLRQRLDAGKEIYTTRISAEKGKYSKGQILDSPFGKLRVAGVKQGKLKQHPFLGELTEDQKLEIGDHPFDLVKLEKEASVGIRMSKEASMSKKGQYGSGSGKSGVGGVQPVQGVEPVEGVGGVDAGGMETGGRKQQQQQELEAWQRWSQDRNKDDFKFLLDSYTPFMNYMGQRHLQAAKTGGTLPVSTIKADMIQNFHRGLETYDPNKGQLNTHIGNHLRHTGRFVRTYSNIGKMPDPRSRMVWQYKDRETVLTERLGRQPSSAEMADDLGMSQKDVELLRMEIRKDIIVDPMTSGLGSIAPESPKAMEQLNFLHMELAPDQQNVLEYTYGMHGRPAIDNNEELAQILGISPQKVRAIKRQIARRYEKRYR